MDLYRKSPKQTNFTPPPTLATDPGGGAGTISIAPLITMIAVLVIILIFCFAGAPAVRKFCRKRVCTCCPEPEADDQCGTPIDNASTTPTIILLPFGRMLVVDRSVFAQFQTDDAGLDFMELSANLIRAHHLQYGSTPSILDSETTSKGLSPSSLGFSPPAYDDICNGKLYDLPPSYSEVSLMFKQQNDNERTNSGGATAFGLLENVRVDEPRHIDSAKFLASEENFEEFDLVVSCTSRRVESVSNVTGCSAARALVKQSSF